MILAVLKQLSAEAFATLPELICSSHVGVDRAERRARSLHRRKRETAVPQLLR